MGVGSGTRQAEGDFGSRIGGPFGPLAFDSGVVAIRYLEARDPSAPAGTPPPGVAFPWGTGPPLQTRRDSCPEFVTQRVWRHWPGGKWEKAAPETSELPGQGRCLGASNCAMVSRTTQFHDENRSPMRSADGLSSLFRGGAERWPEESKFRVIQARTRIW